MNKVSFTATDLKLCGVNLQYQPFLLNYPFPNLKACHIAELTDSIKEYGLLSPVIIQKNHRGEIYIIHGLNRFLASQSLCLITIPAMVIPTDLKEQEVYQFSLSLFLSHKKPNIIEQAKIIKKLLTFFHEGKVIKDYMPRLSLSPSEKTLARIKPLAELEDEIAGDVAHDVLNPQLALELLKLSSSCRILTYRFIKPLSLTVSQQFEVIEHIKEIALREDLRIQNLLDDKDILRILDQDLDQKRKVQDLRLFLRQRRYPALTALEHEFERKIKMLKLPEDMKLYPPPNFEHGDYRFELKFTDLLDFCQNLDFLNKLTKEEKFQTLIDS